MAEDNPVMSRAKFQCNSVKRTGYPTFDKDNKKNGMKFYEEVAFSAVTSGELPEDSLFYSGTPTGNLAITIANQSLIGKYIPGECYYLDFTPAP